MSQTKQTNLVRAEISAKSTGPGPSPKYNNPYFSGYDEFHEKIPHAEGTFGNFIDTCPYEHLLCTKVRHGENDDNPTLAMIGAIPRVAAALVRRFGIEYYNYVYKYHHAGRSFFITFQKQVGKTQPADYSLDRFSITLSLIPLDPGYIPSDAAGSVGSIREGHMPTLAGYAARNIQYPAISLKKNGNTYEYTNATKKTAYNTVKPIDITSQVFSSTHYFVTNMIVTERECTHTINTRLRDELLGEIENIKSTEDIHRILLDYEAGFYDFTEEGLKRQTVVGAAAEAVFENLEGHPSPPVFLEYSREPLLRSRNLDEGGRRKITKRKRSSYRKSRKSRKSRKY